MITFITYKWRPENNGMSHKYRVTYTAQHVNVLVRALEKYYKGEKRIICVTDDPEGVECETFPLWPDHAEVANPSGIHLPGCYRRLKIFDPAQTDEMGIEVGSPVVSLDLDSIVVGPLNALFDGRTEPFLAFRGRGSLTPTVYNGSMYRLFAGKLPHVWEQFDPERSPKQVRRAGYFGSDQGWLSYCLAHKQSGYAPGWDKNDGVLSYSSDLGSTRSRLPKGARIVFFNGKLKPWHDLVRNQSPWVDQYWVLQPKP